MFGPSPRLWTLFVAYVAATAAHIAWAIAHEPFSFDAWNVAVDTNAEPATVSRFLAYWRFEYAHSNPRLGQPLTYLAYKLVGFAEVMTPLAYLALMLAAVVIGLGRWPRRGREWALWAIAIGLGWFVVPQVGRNMFCRAYGANYIWAGAIQLWFVARVRLQGETRSPLLYVEGVLFGIVAGLCNEHTGPTLIACMLGYAWWQRRNDRAPWFALAGALGSAVGFAAIVLAPGQGERYGGLAQQAGLFERIGERGLGGNAMLFRDYAIYAAPIAGLIVLVLLASKPARRHGAHVVVALVAGLAIVATTLASPKLGSRFYIVPMVALLASFIALLDAVELERRFLAPLIAFAVIASAIAVGKTVPLFARVAEQGEARMVALARSTPGAVITVRPYEQVGETWWFIGDDFRSVSKRVMVARYYALKAVHLRGRATR